MSDYIDLLERARLTKDEIGEPDTVNQVLFFDQIEELGIEAGSMVLTTRDISADSIFDADNWDECNWEGTYAYDPVIMRVINPNNRFIERFLDDTFNNSSITTATWNTSGSLTFSTGSSKVASSGSIFLNSQNVYDCLFVVEGTNLNRPTYEISNDGGLNWTTASTTGITTFTTAGNDLRFKITNIGTYPITISKVQIDYRV